MSNVYDADSSPLAGPGSQPTEIDGAELDILQLPSGMSTYLAPSLPEPEDISHLDSALTLLRELHTKLAQWHPHQSINSVLLENLDTENRELIDQVLGEGEVSIIIEDHGKTRIQESVLTGVWRVQYYDENGCMQKDEIEVNAIPSAVRQQTFSGAVSKTDTEISGLENGIMNAPPLLTEINDKLDQFNNDQVAQTINLTLLPQTDQDLSFLDARLGQGKTNILSRGYGNCRITSTATENLWWVRYFNSQDKNILNSLEIAQVPEVACAAPEDIADSRIRLQEILEIYQ